MTAGLLQIILSNPAGLLELPSLVLHAWDPSASMACVLELLMRLRGLSALPRFKPSTATVTMPDAGGRSVVVDQAYAPCGTLLIEVGCASDSHKQAAQMELAKQAAATRSAVNMGGRRLVVMHGAGKLSAHHQQALHNIVENAMQTAFFVFTARRPGELDAPLRSRAIVVDANGSSSGMPLAGDAGPPPGVPSLPDFARLVSAAAAKGTRSARTELTRAQRALTTHLTGSQKCETLSYALRDLVARSFGGPGSLSSATDGDDAMSAAAVQAVADADHAAAVAAAVIARSAGSSQTAADLSENAVIGSISRRLVARLMAQAAAGGADPAR